ncbi:nitroreductase family deazaflavin-dependent oxidoreductase [Nocardioides piscis]|uniref:Nitroreductase family deazaflavin-dependent oxidoreductase n=1 Tax=Nocardioides piscis TaxID=2714938 RepID=A0A6G7YG11_9ACTN|nr:nitroreductase family deazaflavin-dependent oxidoreductase [Nocardioides piscis]QIK75578.1 nitroreductase family deazaflavin-dependent oxidoreductase [Nocardioides piscis]
MTLQGTYEPSPSEWVRNHVEEYEASGGTADIKVMGRPIVVITSRGAKSGLLRKNPVMRIEHDGVYVAVASKGGDTDNPSWYANFKANPVVDLQDGPTPLPYRAREVTGDERAQWWERAVEAFPQYAEYAKATDREIPVFVLEPVAE